MGGSARVFISVKNRNRIWELIKSSHSALLITVKPNGAFDSRPMGRLQSGFDEVLWFLTFCHSLKLVEIRNNPNVMVSYAKPSEFEYVSIAIGRTRRSFTICVGSKHRAWRKGKGGGDIRRLGYRFSGVSVVAVCQPHYPAGFPTKLTSNEILYRKDREGRLSRRRRTRH